MEFQKIIKTQLFWSFKCKKFKKILYFDQEILIKLLKKNTVNPDCIFHLAAQALVGKSYNYPFDTIQNNLISSLNLFEIMRVIKKM